MTDVDHFECSLCHGGNEDRPDRRKCGHQFLFSSACRAGDPDSCSWAECMCQCHVPVAPQALDEMRTGLIRLIKA